MYGLERGKKILKLPEVSRADSAVTGSLQVSKPDARSCIKKQ